MNGSDPLMVGWREWVSLPDLELPAIKVKVDTGARTSALHALNIQHVRNNSGPDTIRFVVQPIQRMDRLQIACEAPLVDIRNVSDSGGHVEERYVVGTRLQLGSIDRAIEITLSERRNMLFRMLLGRTALVPDMLVSPAESYLCGRRLSAEVRALYAADVENR